MNVQKRKELLVRLGNYMSGNDEDWQAARQKATAENPWFTPEFIALSVTNIVQNFLQAGHIQQLIDEYRVTDQNIHPKKVGIVMAGNIPLVGFHDVLCVFLSGHIAMIKPSSKDEALMKHLIDRLIEWDKDAATYLVLSERIPNCDAYIATGSNNSARYFEFYFKKYPSIIRKNRTSVAVLTGKETPEELEKLADDVYQYFGLGCRNVTKIFVPEKYDFVPLLGAFKKYDHLSDHNKYKNNYDYNLAVLMLNHQYYMTNGSILLVENESPFSPISQLHFQYYTDKEAIMKQLQDDDRIQCLIGTGHIPFGRAQLPCINDYADRVDTMEFLMGLG